MGGSGVTLLWPESRLLVPEKVLIQELKDALSILLQGVFLHHPPQMGLWNLLQVMDGLFKGVGSFIKGQLKVYNFTRKCEKEVK